MEKDITKQYKLTNPNFLL